MSSLRIIPAIDRLLARPALADAVFLHGRARVTDATRFAAEALRTALQSGDPAVPDTEDAASEWIEQAALADLASRAAGSLRRVINGTGVIIHTNLGRSPLAQEALVRMAHASAGYSNLEYDLAEGERGHRHVHAERLICELTGAGAALVVNNNAAAVLVVLAALAEGWEVVVSRGELVEIGGGFRVPEVLAQSGALLREVGTTNRTRVSDYAAAIGERTALLLRVHPSNFRIEGFTERPATADLAALGQRFGVPLVEDLGSGWLGVDPHALEVLADEPTAGAALEAGADLVTFSGDKLLGGPQAGIVAGRPDLIERVRRHPLMRAVRADKLALAALEATLDLWARSQLGSIPVVRMLTMSLETMDRRAAAMVARLGDTAGLRCEILDGLSTVGGGAAPESSLPTRLLAVSVENLTASALESRLRAGDPPVIARIEDGVVVLDLRTVDESEDGELVRVLEAFSIRR